MDEWWDRKPHEYRIRVGLSIFSVVVLLVGLIGYKFFLDQERRDLLKIAGETKIKSEETQEAQRAVRERAVQVRDKPAVRPGVED